MDDVIIRRAMETDIDTIGRLWTELVEFHRDVDDELPKAASSGATMYARRISDRLDDDHSRTFVAEVDGRVVGFVLGVIVDLVAEMFMPDIGGFLADIHVSSDYRKRGIGRKLVQELAHWFRESGVTFIELSVAYQNADARKFWASLGGRELMIRMRLPLELDESKED